MSTSPTKKTIELQADATVPRGASIKLTVEYRSKIDQGIECNCIHEHHSILSSMGVMT
jgi:hypothetical protein